MMSVIRNGRPSRFYRSRRDNVTVITSHTEVKQLAGNARYALNVLRSSLARWVHEARSVFVETHRFGQRIRSKTIILNQIVDAQLFRRAAINHVGPASV